MRKCLSVLCLLAAAAFRAGAAAQGAPGGAAEDLRAVLGGWEGRLRYLDYKDNKSWAELPAALAWRCAEGRVEDAFTYTEPNGAAVAGFPNTLRPSAACLLINQEEWRVERSAAGAGGRGYTLVLTPAGSDHDRPADLRRTLSLAGGELKLTTEVRPAGAAEYFVRNEYRLKRKK